MFSNYTSLGEDDFPISPISCFKLNLIALYLTMLLVASSVVNSFLAMAFLVYKELYKSVNILVLACVLLNLLGSILELPFVIGSNFACRWIFEKIGCYISAYLMYLVGCIQIYIMTAISMERYYIVRNLKILTNKTSEQSIKVLIVCFFLGFMWPTFPLIGWSNYVLEDGLTSCSVNWKDQSLNVKSYNVAIFLFVYIIPITVISICSIMSVKSVSKMDASQINFIMNDFFKSIKIRNLPIMSTTNNSKNSKHNKIERAITIQMMIFVRKLKY